MELINNTFTYQNHRYYKIEDIDDFKQLIGPKSPLWKILENHKGNGDTTEALNVTNSTLLSNYDDHTSAATYIIAVILVYGLSMAFIIGSLITKRKEEHTAEKDIRQWVHINSVQDQLKRQMDKQAVKQVLHRQVSEVNSNNIKPIVEEEVFLLGDSVSSRSSQSAPDNQGLDLKSGNNLAELKSLDSSFGTYDLSYATEDFKKEIFSGMVRNGTNSTLSESDCITTAAINGGTSINSITYNTGVNIAESPMAPALKRTDSFNKAQLFLV